MSARTAIGPAHSEAPLPISPPSARRRAARNITQRSRLPGSFGHSSANLRSQALRIFLLALENVACATQSAILVQGAFRPPAGLCHSHDREGSTPRSGQSSRCIIRRRRFVNTPASSANHFGVLPGLVSGDEVELKTGARMVVVLTDLPDALVSCGWLDSDYKQQSGTFPADGLQPPRRGVSLPKVGARYLIA
jgi:uncharacterized protein YodC (DUF2158 family)